MISPARSSSHRRPSLPPAPAGQHPYGAPFWYAYAANFLLAAGVAILYRYADFVTLIGGSEFHLGWIVGVGMVGSMLMRLVMGQGIDRRGPVLVWQGSLVLFVVACFAHLAVGSPTGVAVYLLRIAYCCATAGVFGTSLSFVSSRAPLTRMAELVGMIGTAGFLGNIVGTQLGDYLHNGGALDRWQIDQMFLLAGVLGLAAIPVSWLAMRNSPRPAPAAHPPLWRLLRQHHPGWLLPAVVALGLGLNLPFIFLASYAVDLDIPRIALFFTVYSITAIITRIVTRQWPQRLGLRKMILLGSAGLAVAQVAFLLVGREWHLMLPGIAYGMSHAVLFPATVAAGNVRFPPQYRGLGTALMLTMWDAGQLIGMPAAGLVLHYSDALGLPPYPSLFVLGAGLVGMIGIGYAWSQPDDRGSSELDCRQLGHIHHPHHRAAQSQATSR